MRTRNLDRASLFRCIRRLRRHRTDGRTRYVLLGQGLCVPILWSLASPPDRTYTRSPYAPLSKEASVTACHHPTNVHIAGFAFNRTESGAGGDPRRGLTVQIFDGANEQEKRSWWWDLGRCDLDDIIDVFINRVSGGFL
jgi:hypothetical protein